MLPVDLCHDCFILQSTGLIDIYWCILHSSCNYFINLDFEKKVVQYPQDDYCEKTLTTSIDKKTVIGFFFCFLFLKRTGNIPTSKALMTCIKMTGS